MTRFMSVPARLNPEALANDTLMRSGQPRMPNGRAIDVELIVREFCKLEPMYIPDLNLRGKRVLGLFCPSLNAILINQTCIEVRQRFTIAHETGHVQLEHRHGSALSLFGIEEPEIFGCTADDEDLASMDEVRAESQSMLRRVKEIRANRFAACLLMPEGLVREVWRVEHGSLERAADALMVSKEALGYRLDSLGLS